MSPHVSLKDKILNPRQAFTVHTKERVKSTSPSKIDLDTSKYFRSQNEVYK